MTAVLAKPQPKLTSSIKPASFVRLSLQTICYLATCLAALEGVFYLGHVGESEYIKPDLTVGYKPMEGKEMTQRREGFARLKINSFGMQNDEITLAKPRDVLRIAVMGDSYVEAMQVGRNFNYCSLLAHDLSQKLKQKVEVLNFGVASYSIAQDYLRYETLAKKFAPDLVILSFRAEETVRLLPYPTDQLMAVRPVFFANPDGSLIYDNTCVRNFLSSNVGKRIQKTYWLRRNSRIWGVIGSMALTVSAAPTPLLPAKLLPAKQSLNTHSANNVQLARANYIHCYWHLMDAQLKTLAAACRANHSKMIILRSPSGSVNDTETQLLEESACNIGVNVLDIDKKYRKTFVPADAQLHFSNLGHFTKVMHSWVETQLADYLTLDHPELVQAAINNRQ